MNLEQALPLALQDIGLALDASQQAQLLHYLQLLQKWNKVYNLTAVRHPDDMFHLHLLDCLAAMPLFAEAIGQRQATRILDVGAGGGLPGVVLAICFPQVQVHCVDAVAKKMAFVQQVAASLPLPNLKAIHARVEHLPGQYDIVTSRAFASLHDFVNWTGSALAPQGLWLAMKGKHPQAEIDELPAHVRMFHVKHLQVPGLDAERCLVYLAPEGAL